MKHIEKITISNARRLGANVEIDFGAGATIILAPNGTGKTTIFEAIELALTGEIQRLEGPPDAIIRDGLTSMNVRLDFPEGKYYKMNYRKGGKLERIGDYDELFEIENQSSFPYLFRLTHFLEQRSNEWFIDQDGKKAGDLLSQLPLGKDLQNILSKKQSLLTAISKARTSAGEDLSGAEKKLSEFNELISKRDGLATQNIFIPLKEIVAELLVISKLISCDDYKDEYNLTPINSYFEKVRVLLKQEVDRKNDFDIKLSALNERVQLYSSNLELLTHKQIVISEHSMKIAALTPVIEQTKNDLQIGRGILLGIQDEIKKLNSLKSMFEEIEQQIDYFNVKNIELEQNEKLLCELQQSYETTVEYLKKNERLRDQFKLIEDSINDNINILNQIDNKKEIQKQWQNLRDINNEIIKTIPLLEKKKDNYLESKLRLDDEVSKAENEYSIKKNYLESLNEASGAIQNAVSIIRINLVDNQNFCPVCQAVYEPEDLIKRIEKSLDTLNPAIPKAIKEEQQALAVFEEVKEIHRKESQKIQDTISELNFEKSKFETNQKTISESILSHFSGINSPEDARSYIENQILQITLEIREIEMKRSQLEPHEDSHKIDNAKLKKSEDERAINDLKTKKIQLQNEINAAEQKTKSIADSLGSEQKDTVLNCLLDKSNLEKEIIDKINSFENGLLETEKELKAYQDSCFLENEAISKLKGSQGGISAEWERAGLQGQPNQNSLILNHEVVKKSIDELKTASIGMNKIEQELANWRAAEEFNKINSEVKKQIGNVSEAGYLYSLKTFVFQKNSVLQNILEKSKAVNVFFENVMSESQQIHEELDAINEPWKGLLKRIVISPLISNAPLLNNTVSRNKLIAKTSATVHNRNIDIAQIASEAQLTDLQLTLMLSMANRYQWTPWKALLLDDPTQHHDLVHASSVFDVLRDYIIEFDYQVMMSTHDSIQAKYFQRKLENEGVPSKIYQLVDRKSGVAAERII